MRFILTINTSTLRKSKLKVGWSSEPNLVKKRAHPPMTRDVFCRCVNPFQKLVQVQRVVTGRNEYKASGDSVDLRCAHSEAEQENQEHCAVPHCRPSTRRYGFTA